jgi:CDGSH-type Zn-finger protein
MERANKAGDSPQMVNLEAGKTYAWCSCGNSGNQPWCDGTHKGSGFTPTVFKAEESKTVAVCMCKQTKNPSFCDGSHMNS